MRKIPRSHKDCSYCITPESYNNEPGPCADHKGPNGEYIEYTGYDVYEPSEWVLSVVGKNYRTFNWVKDGLPMIYNCFGYDPRHGFWMVNVEDPNDKCNISEGAIGTNYRRVR